MPTTSEMLKGAIISAAIIAGGSYLASFLKQASSTSATVMSTENTTTITAIDAPSAVGLNVTITDVHSNYGKIIVTVFGNKESYKNSDYNKSIGYKEVDAKRGLVLVNFPELTKDPMLFQSIMMKIQMVKSVCMATIHMKALAKRA